MIQHELLLCVEHRAIRAFKHRDFVINNVLVKVCVEQGLQSEHGVTHGTFVDHPERERGGGSPKCVRFLKKVLCKYILCQISRLSCCF